MKAHMPASAPPTPMMAPKASEDPTTSNSALLDGMSTSNGQEDTPMLDEAEQGERLFGNDVGDFRSDFGEPSWAIQQTGIGSGWFRDRLEVKCLNTGEGAKADPSKPSLGSGMATSTGYQTGGLQVLNTDTPGGEYQADWSTPEDNHVYSLQYYPAREREGVSDNLRGPDGETTLLSGLATYVEVVRGGIKAVDPVTPAAEALAGRDADPFGADFGKQLSVPERVMKAIEAAAKLATLGQIANPFQALSTADQVAIALSMVQGAGEPAIDNLERSGWLSPEVAGYCKLGFQIIQLYPALMNHRAGETGIGDLITLLQTASAGGHEAVRRILGDEAYEKWWQPNHEILDQVIGVGSDFWTIFEAIAG